MVVGSGFVVEGSGFVIMPGAVSPEVVTCSVVV